MSVIKGLKNLLTSDDGENKKKKKRSPKKKLSKKEQEKEIDDFLEKDEKKKRGLFASLFGKKKEKEEVIDASKFDDDDIVFGDESDDSDDARRRRRRRRKKKKKTYRSSDDSSSDEERRTRKKKHHSSSDSSDDGETVKFSDVKKRKKKKKKRKGGSSEDEGRSRKSKKKRHTSSEDSHDSDYDRKSSGRKKKRYEEEEDDEELEYSIFKEIFSCSGFPSFLRSRVKNSRNKRLQETYARMKQLRELVRTGEIKSKRHRDEKEELGTFNKIVRCLSQLHNSSSSSSSQLQLDFFRLSFPEVFYEYYFSAYVACARREKFEHLIPYEFKQSLLAASRKFNIDDEDEDVDELNPKEVVEAFRNWIQEEDKYIPMKLVVSHLPKGEHGYANFLVKFIANNFTEKGAVHLALQIGPYIIDWNDSSLTRPRYFKSNNAIAAIDLNNRRYKWGDEKFWRRLAKKCVGFNLYFKYSVRSSLENLKRSQKMNCQSYVEYLMSVFKLEKWWEEEDGSINRLLKQIKKSGNAKSRLAINLEFTNSIRPPLSEIQMKTSEMYGKKGGKSYDQDFQLLRSYECAAFLRGEKYPDYERHAIVNDDDRVISSKEKNSRTSHFRKKELEKKKKRKPKRIHDSSSNEDDDEDHLNDRKKKRHPSDDDGNGYDGESTDSEA